MGWLSKLLKASSSSGKGKSSIRSATDDDSESQSSSRHSTEGVGEDQSDSSEEVIADEYCSSHHWHDELASHLTQSAGLSVESPPPTYHRQDNHQDSYYLGYGFQPYSSPLHHSIGHGNGYDFNWTDDVWPIHVSDNTSNQFTTLQYDDRTYQYFSNGYSNRHTICDVCKQYIPINSSGALQVREDPIWQLKYCLKHLKDGTSQCLSCNRFQALGQKYSSYESGEKICADCKPYAIMNIDDCQPLIQEIYDFYEELNMRLYQTKIQIHVIEPKEMMRLHGPGTQGITSWGELCIFTTLTTTGKHFKLVSHTEVKNIQLKAGRPRLMIEFVLAHEMMHAWLALEGFVGDPTEGFVGNLKPNHIHEGICQVMAHKWLKSQVECHYLGSNFEIKLVQHYMRGIEERRDDPYGTGFQIVYPVVNKYGLKGTLDYVRMNGRLPQ